MKKSKIGYLIIGSAIIWGAVIIGSAVILKGTPYKEQMIRLIWGGTMFHFLFIWAPLGTLFKSDKAKRDDVKSEHVNLKK